MKINKKQKNLNLKNNNKKPRKSIIIKTTTKNQTKFLLFKQKYLT